MKETAYFVRGSLRFGSCFLDFSPFPPWLTCASSWRNPGDADMMILSFSPRVGRVGVVSHADF
jgi:hypothetical protein